MLEFTLNHPLMCSADRFWALFLDPGFTREMLTGLGFARVDVGELRPGASSTDKRRSMRSIPKLDLPAVVARLVGEAFAYVEEGSFDERSRRWTYQSRISVMEQFRVGGRIWVEPTKTGRCRRISEVWIEAKIFGIGGLVERAAESNVRDGFRRSALWINRWVVGHPEAPQPSGSVAAP